MMTMWLETWSVVVSIDSGDYAGNHSDVPRIKNDQLQQALASVLGADGPIGQFGCYVHGGGVVGGRRIATYPAETLAVLQGVGLHARGGGLAVDDLEGGAVLGDGRRWHLRESAAGKLTDHWLGRVLALLGRTKPASKSFLPTERGWYWIWLGGDNQCARAIGAVAGKL